MPTNALSPDSPKQVARFGGRPGPRGSRRPQVAEIEFGTIPTACNIFALSRDQVYDLLKAGSIRGKKDGGRTLIDLASVRVWIRNLPDYGADHLGDSGEAA